MADAPDSKSAGARWRESSPGSPPRWPARAGTRFPRSPAARHAGAGRRSRRRRARRRARPRVSRSLRGRRRTDGVDDRRPVLQGLRRARPAAADGAAADRNQAPGGLPVMHGSSVPVFRLLFPFQFAFFLRSTLGLFVLFPFAFVSFALVTHVRFPCLTACDRTLRQRVFEKQRQGHCSRTSRATRHTYSQAFAA